MRSAAGDGGGDPVENHGTIAGADGGDPVENHGTISGADRVRCKYCAKEVRGFNRLKHHLGGVGTDVVPCFQAPSPVKDGMRTSLLDRKKERLLQEIGALSHPELPLKRTLPSPSNHSPSKTTRCTTPHLDHKPNTSTSEADPAARSIATFFDESGLDLTTANIPAFQNMLHPVVRCGVGFTAPRYQDLTESLLRDELTAAEAYVDGIKRFWEDSGCSVLLDCWIDLTGRSLMTFLVHCPKGTVFLKSVDATHTVKDVDALYYLICSVVEEVGVENVVQVIAHDSSSYMQAAAKKLRERYKTVFWNLCADHCINMILEQIGNVDHVKEVLAQAKTITRFVYRHLPPLKLMKRYIAGGGLVKTSKLRYVAAFMTLENLVSQKENLLSMFRSEEWNVSSWASSTKGKNICDLVKSQSFWAAANDVIKITNPLVGVLDQMTADKCPMGFLYDAMDRAKLAIKLSLGGREVQYMPLWVIIDDIWDNYLHSPLHSAGYYLNPSLFYSHDFFDAEVTHGVLGCIVGMVEDQHHQTLIVQDLDAYKEASGGFGEEMAIAQRTKVSPVLWWALHGESSPDLQRLAIKILAQTCSGALRFKLRRSLSEQLHAEGINCIERQRFADLEFVGNNLQLCHFPSGGDEKVEELNPCDEWIVE